MASPVNSAPAVSVIIPAFNAAAHIAAALDSVFAQTFLDYEIVLVNDGSPDTDQLEEAIRPFLARISYMTQENRGPSAARNAGIRHAHGKWIAFLDSDDIWLPPYLEKQLGFLKNNPALDMAFCDASLEGETAALGRTFMDVCPSVGPVTFESVLVEKTQVLTSATVARREALMGAGLFDENLRCSEDHDLWLRVLHNGDKVSYQRQVLVRRRVRPDSQGSTPGALLAGEIQSLTKLARELELTPARQKLLHERLRQIQAAHAFVEGKALLMAGATEKAHESLNRSYALAPNAKLRAMLVGLRIAPGLTAMGARFWRRRAAGQRQA